MPPEEPSRRCIRRRPSPGLMPCCTPPPHLPCRWPPAILDTDTTVKCLYGKQEGAVVGYNPQKKGRPSHNYHSCFMGNTRLALTVEVNPGNHQAASHPCGTIFVAILPRVGGQSEARANLRRPFSRQRGFSGCGRTTGRPLSQQVALDHRRQTVHDPAVSSGRLGRCRQGLRGGRVPPQAHRMELGAEGDRPASAAGRGGSPGRRRPCPVTPGFYRRPRDHAPL